MCSANYASAEEATTGTDPGCLGADDGDVADNALSSLHYRATQTLYDLRKVNQDIDRGWEFKGHKKCSDLGPWTLEFWCFGFRHARNENESS